MSEISEDAKLLRGSRGYILFTFNDKEPRAAITWKNVYRSEVKFAAAVLLKELEQARLPVGS